jgi:ribosome-binding protein aMBF1 (putative translation factor)
MSAHGKQLDGLPDDAKARIDAAREYRRSAEGRAELERVRAAVREDFPPLPPDPELSEALAALRFERERQGLSLAELAERIHTRVSYLMAIEAGINLNVRALRAYAHALGKRLSWTITDLTRAS